MNKTRVIATADKPNVDTRVLTFHSHGAVSSMGFPEPGNENHYYNFSYYDELFVDGVESEVGRSPLQSAYDYMLKRDKNHRVFGSFYQTIVAFTDISPQEGNRYSKEHIEAFWADQSYPLFFVSLINIKNGDDIDGVLKCIETIFAESQHLAYLTFDHCDIILFVRSTSFAEYTRMIFDLKFSEELKVEDCITLYSFTFGKKTLVDSEAFSAYIRIGVKDFKKAASFYTELQDIDGKNASELEYGWMLGRNDIGFFKRNATTAWIIKVNELMKKQKKGDDWYSTYKLSILIPPQMSAIRSNTVPAENNPTVFNGMQTALQSFETLYKEKCKAIGTAPNEIWLRWLKDAAMLSQSLLNTKLTVDLGACLVPQFIDLLEYATLLFTSDTLGMTHMDAIRNCFTTFFNNISALIDSTNHSNRQFVQVPPFHPASFEMPPKIMAYYVALAHRLIDVLKDSNENYDLTISPKFAKELDVTSIAIPEVTGLNQFLSISIGEQSLYALRHTTEVFGHEISHFVGNSCRSRAVRKRLLLRVGIQTFLEDMAKHFPQHLTRNAPVPDFDETMPDVGIKWGKTKECVDALYDLLLRTNIELSDEKDLYLRDLENELKDLPNFIISDPEICEKVFRFLYESYFLESKWGTWYAKRSGESPDPKKTRTKWKSVEETRRKIYEAKLRQDFDQMFEDYMEANVWNQAESTSRLYNQINRHEHFCYLFSETYADLQVIRLLDMTQEQYQRMFRGIKAEDLKPRTLAVTTALAKQKIWKMPKEPEEKMLVLRPPQDTAVYLQDRNINPALFHAQVEYLCECSNRMTDKLKQDNLQAAIKDIRHIYSTMSKNGSVLELDKDLFDFVSRYYKTLNARLKPSH